MRTIKFRAWDRQAKKMLDNWRNAYMDIWDGVVYEFTGGCGEDEDTTTNRLDLEIMQFTGIVDKYGNEIYEGDILKFDDGEIVEIVFFCGAFMPKLNKCQGITIHDNSKPEWKNGEIVGNAFENPELLK